MFCPQCGRENPPGSNFCNYCGAAISAKAIAPGVGSSFGHGWRTLRQNFADLFLAFIVYLALIIPVVVVLGVIVYFGFGGHLIFVTESSSGRFLETSWEFQLANAVTGMIYYIPLAFGLFFISLMAIRGEKIHLGDIFISFNNYREILLAGVFFVVLSNGVSFLLSLLTGHFPVLGTLLSLAWTIFYIILMCKLAFTPFLLLDRRMRFVDALRTSWLMTRGHEWKVFFIGVLGVLMFAAVGLIAFLISLVFILLPFFLIIGLIVAVIGFIFLSIWLIATYASLYQDVNIIPPPSPPSP